MLLYRVFMEEFAIYKAMDFLVLVPQGLQENSVKVSLYRYVVAMYLFCLVNIHPGASD